jgi:hypothetical protein
VYNVNSEGVICIIPDLDITKLKCECSVCDLRKKRIKEIVSRSPQKNNLNIRYGGGCNGDYTDSEKIQMQIEARKKTYNE